MKRLNAARFYMCPKDGKNYELPPGLSLHQRHIPGKWRYRNLNDKSSTQASLASLVEGSPAYISTEDAIAITNALNLQNGVSSVTEKPMQGALIKLGDAFILEEIERRRSNNKHMVKRFRTDCNYVRRMARELDHIPLSKLNDKILTDWFHNRYEFNEARYIKSPHAQRGMRYILSLFTGFLLLRKCTGIEKNVFNFEVSDIKAEFKSKPEKIRQRMTLGQFYLIREAANKDNCHWLVNAIDFGLATGMRCGDIVDLQFDKHFFEGQIRKTINKSMGQKGLQKAFSKKITLKNRPDILEIINRCMATRNDVIKSTRYGEELRPATHLIHDPKHLMRKSQSKIHYSQVLPDDVERAFKKYRDSCEAFNNIPPEERPTFHEIRGLYVHIRKQKGDELSDIQKDVAHSSQKMTEGYASGHMVDYDEIDHCLTHDDLQDHLVWEKENKSVLMTNVRSRKHS